MLRRVRIAVQAGAALAIGVVVACSSFGADNEPSQPLDEAGIDGALAETSAPDAATTCAADVMTDPRNCGKCGHDCQAGACTKGRCQPFKLAEFTDQPVANVVLSATNVFWNTMESVAAGSGNVYTCPKAGCGAAFTILPPAGNVVRGLGSDGDKKTFAGAFYGGGGLFALDPSSVTPKLNVAAGGYPLQMSVRPEAIFYFSFYDPNNDRTVRRWDYVDAPTVQCTYSAGEQTTAAAFTATRAYLASNSVGKLYSCPLAGGAFGLYRDSFFLASLTATADRVFWVLNGSVESSADGPTSSTLAAVIGPQDVGSNVTTVTVTGGDLFVTTTGGELWSCAPNDCKNTLVRVAKEGMLETSLSFVSHTVAADAEAVYYVTVDPTAPEGGVPRTARLMKVMR